MATSPPTRLEGNVYVNGTLTALTNTPSALIITDAMVAAAAAIAATKLNHEHRIPYAQPNTTATTETKALYACRCATATVTAFECGSIVANIGAATVTLDLKKNGTTVLSAVVTLNSSSTAYIVQTGTISVPGLVDGDVLSVVVTATAGGGTLATGVFANISVTETGI